MQTDKKYFAAILPSPRPTFPMDMSDEENQIMQAQLLLESDPAQKIGKYEIYQMLAELPEK